MRLPFPWDPGEIQDDIDSLGGLLGSYSVKGVDRSKFYRGYVKVDALGVTLLFTRSKSDKN